MIQHDLKSSNISLEKKMNDQDHLNKQFPLKIEVSAPSAYVDKNSDKGSNEQRSHRSKS